MEIAHCLPSSIYDEFMIKLQALIVSEKGVFLDDTYYDSIGCLLNQFTKWVNICLKYSYIFCTNRPWFLISAENKLN